MARKDKVITPSVTQKIQELGYNVSDWDDSQTASKLTPEILNVLNKSSKSKNGSPGYPDRIYCNKNARLLIIVEEKPSMVDHKKTSVIQGTISGLHWYLKGFMNEDFSEWKILGIAVSGDLAKDFGFSFDAFMIEDSKEIVHLPTVTNFLTEEQFLSIFNNFDEEKAVIEISKASKEINSLLRSVDSQKRPILLSALMIGLYEPKDMYNSFPHSYKKYTGGDILDNLSTTVRNILKNEGIPDKKIVIIENELSVFTTDNTLRNSNILKDILDTLEESVLPLFVANISTRSNYDIMGKFYEEFLRYAGISNVKKGIVLTPRHITTLFTKLVPLKSDDIIVDFACGTGAFLIAGMNKLIEEIENSNRNDKEKAIKNVKEKQLLGFELNSTMYILAISNMLFRGDGKSSIYNYDSINDPRTDKILDKVKPTIGFINPPYSGKETKKNPTPKEITFVSRMLENVSRYGVVIAPLSMFYGEKNTRTNILKKHTLKYVINMPKELFHPNAMTQTAIAVFETNVSHDYSNDVVFYDLEDDGFILTKNKGRTDFYNKWDEIEEDIIDSLIDKSISGDGINLIKTPIEPDDEWTIYAHSKTDYEVLTKGHFINTMTDYLIYIAKKESSFFESDGSEFELVQLISNYYGSAFLTKDVSDIVNSFVPNKNWKLFNVHEVFDEIVNTKGKTTYDLAPGDQIPYIGAKKSDNGQMYLVDLEENQEYISRGNGIVFINLGDGSGGYSTYQEEDFIGMSGKTSVGYQENLNLFNALFIVTMLDLERYRYSFGRNWSGDRFDNSNIFLPATDEGTPDWDFMELFIKNLPFSELLTEETAEIDKIN